MESEKQLLIEDQSLEPLRWMCKTSLEGKYSDSGLDVSDDSCSIDGHNKDATSWMQNEEKHLARRKLFIACAVSLIFMTGEAVGGFAAHSLAIMTDAAHLLTDFCSILISIFSLWISSKPQTMSFGWQRAEILGMFLSIMSIWAVTAVLVLSAFQRIIDGDYEIDSHIMLVTSGCAVGVNMLMALILHQPGASHGHSHGFPTSQPQRDEECHSHHHSSSNASVKAAFIHVLGDLLQSIGVLSAATVIHFRPELKVADPICTFLFSILVVGTTLPVTKDIFRILMEGTPQDVNIHSVRKKLLSVSGVQAVHSLRMWSLNTTQSLLSVHVNT
ncbi:hypothetical protein LDENG_00222390, partial [Lucifuga dentata]